MTDPPSGCVRGVVLAGGESLRFGAEDKALATFDGEPLVSHVVSTLRAATGVRPVLAAGTDAHAATLLETLPDLPTVPDADGFEGPLAGLLAAADTVSVPWIVVCGCDMPLVSSGAVRTLLDRATREADAVVVRDETGHPEPLFAAYRTAAVRRGRRELAPAAGPRSLLDGLSDVRAVGVADHPSLARAVTNVNTRDELRSLAESRPGESGGRRGDSR